MIVNTVKYYYDTEGKMTKKVITAASGSAQTIYYETNDDKTIVKFSAGGRTVTSHSKTDSFGRKVFDELQLGTDFVSRQFVYHAGKVTAAHKEKAKVKIFVIPTDEELVITEDAYALMKGTYDVHTSFHYSFEDPNYVNKARERGLVNNLKKKPEIASIIAYPPNKTK